MKDDNAIKSVRDVRQLISESLKHDPKNIVEYYKKLQVRHEDRLISEPKRELSSKLEGEEAA